MMKNKKPCQCLIKTHCFYLYYYFISCVNAIIISGHINQIVSIPDQADRKHLPAASVHMANSRWVQALKNKL